MGLFQTSYKTYVSSVAYNMAGELADRPDYLKATTITSVLGGSKSLGGDIVQAYLKGPGISQRSFYRWSKTNFPIGTCEGAVNQTIEIPLVTLVAEIPLGVGESVSVQAAFLDMGDITYWGERWMLANKPLEYADAWLADFDGVTQELVLTFLVGPEERVYYPDFDNTKKYIFAYYIRTLADTSELPDLFIYEIGSGNAVLDALDVDVSAAPEIFPVIPLRLNNKSISDPSYAVNFPSIAKCYKKATGGNISDLLASIEDPPTGSIDDVDYAFLVHGVELNTEENCGKHYLYQFFKQLIPDQKTTPLEFANWLFMASGYTTAVSALAAWTAAQADPLDPLYDTPKPSVPVRTELEVSRFSVKTISALNYQTNVGWVTIDENLHAGLGKVGAKKGDFWTELEANIVAPEVVYVGGTWTTTVANSTVGRFKLFWQDEDASYRVLNIYGMFHENFVYAGRTVVISAKQALEDTDTSGFVVPLHYPTLVAMPLVLSTQLAMSSKIIVFNCYEIVKTRWYETGLGRFIISVFLAVVVAVVFPGSVGLLGSSLSVGVSLGFVGVTAIIVGAVANTLAAMILSTIIMKGSTALFGEELGAVVGAVATMFAMSYATSLSTGVPYTFDFNFAGITRAENLLRMTDVLATLAGAWSQGEVSNIQDRRMDAYSSYQKSSEDIESKRLAEIGYGALAFNPLMLTNTDGPFSSGFDQRSSRMTQPESPSTFLTRTLLTGDDIVKMCLAMVRDYPAISLELPKPFT